MKFTPPMAIRLSDVTAEHARRDHELRIIELQKAIMDVAASIATTSTTSVPTTRAVNTTSPLAGGGTLASDLTLSVGTFGAAVSGVVPSSGGGAVNFLRADGTWAVPLGALWFGDGSDGALNFDGTSVVLGITPSGGKYTLTRDVFASSMTVALAATIKTNGYRIYCKGALTLNGTIDNSGAKGADATGSGANAAGGAGNFFGVGTTGGASTTTGGGVGANQTLPVPTSCRPGTGGAGGNGAGGSGGAAGTLTNVSADTNGSLHEFNAATLGRLPQTQSQALGGGTGGGAGAGNGAGIQGADGGGGGGWVVVVAFSITGTGSITANGGNGGTANAGANCGGGGGGGGGYVVIVIASGSYPTATANGGTGGAGSGTGTSGGNGNNGQVLKFGP